MLTSADLKNIQEIVRTEVEAESETIKSSIGGDILRLKMEMSTRIGKLEDRMKNIEIASLKTSKELNKEAQTIKLELKKLRIDLNNGFKYTDELYIRLRSQVEAIEKLVEIPRN